MSETFNAVEDAVLAENYRVLNSTAVLSLCFGVLSVSSLFDWRFCAIALVGIFLGIKAILTMRRLPEDFTGANLAKAGIALSAFFMLAGISLSAYVYATEVPENHTRVTFDDLRPENNAVEPIPDPVKGLDGQKVFIKGYVRPGKQMNGIREFLLVRDNGACCYGNDLPAFYDMITVKLTGQLRLDYSTRLFKVAGILRIKDDVSVVQGHLQRKVAYQLEGDYLQ